MTARPIAVAAALAAFTLAGCSSSGSSSTPSTSSTASGGTGTTTTTAPGKGKPPIVIGDKNYTEQFLLGELYSEALQAEGFSVSLDQNIGINQSRIQQFQSGELTMYPEYLNVWNAQIAGNTRRFKTIRAAYRAAQSYAAGQKLELLAYTPFSDTTGIAVTSDFATQNELRDIGDLSAVAASLALGGPPQLQQDTTEGLPALKAAYGFTPAAYKSLEIGNQYKALDQDTVQAAYVNTTDGEFSTGNYTLLADPERIFGIGNVVPVVSAKMLAEEGPAFAATVNKVSALLTEPVIREMNALVDLAGESPAGVASRFLADHGLIPPSSAVGS